MRRVLGILIVLLIAALLALPKLRSRAAADKEEAPPPAASGPLAVRALRLVPEELVEELATTGTVRAGERVELVSEIAGKVSKILFAEGSRVAADEPLVEIDATELLAEHQRVSFRVELAERREARQRQLREEGVISEEGYDLALNQLNVLRAELRLIEAQLVKTEIRAPFAGVIGLRYISPGSYLTPQTRIASLQDVERVKLDFSVPEKYAARLRPGHQVSFRVKGAEQAFVAEIYAVEPSVDPETRSLLLRARCPNPGGVLVPGAFADVRLVVERIAEALTVPSIAVVPELGGKKVFVLVDGKAEPRPVETGIRSRERVEIRRGLEPGELVITSAIQQLRPGLEVEAQEI